MFLTITTTRRPATDLGYLLHKHPDRVRAVELSGGSAHVFYPEAGEQRCTAALLAELDPISLVRGGSAGSHQYVNDRPYASGSHLAVALRSAFRTAMAGRCKERPELVEQQFPLEIHLPCCSGDAELAERFFAPLGWQVTTTAVPLDPQFPEWGGSGYLDLWLRGEAVLADALTQLYVLLPALDGDKHYWINSDEVDKLLRTGQRWLPEHPERETITKRYLSRSKRLAGSALARLAESDDTTGEALDDALTEAVVTEAPRQPETLASLRRDSVLATLRSAGANRVLDLGCGSGALLRELLRDPEFTEIVGVDVSTSALGAAERALNFERMSERERSRISLRQSALTYVDRSLAGFDAAVLMEVIEHVDEHRLPALEHAVFGTARPGTVLVTTPNAEYNVLFPGTADGAFRHRDHRFEWDRAEFTRWAQRVATERGYHARLLSVGTEDPEVGPPSQLAVFTAHEKSER